MSVRQLRPLVRICRLPLIALCLLLSCFLLACTDSGVNNPEQIDLEDDHPVAGDGQPDATDTTNRDSTLNHDATLKYLADHYTTLPEGLVAISEDRSIYAQYAEPTDRYGHGILGDRIEAGQLVVLRDGTSHVHTLETQYVYEDLRPRLVDVDGDGDPEIVTIRTHVGKGAGIMIYKIDGGALTEFAWVDEIGTSSRWLNIAALYDLDGDGTMELAWVQTPHIGGILKVARITAGELSVLAQVSQFSNHAIGERNLCLSVVTEGDDGTTLYVPTQSREQIAGFQFTEDAWVGSATIDQQVDFSQSLASQHDFSSVVQGGDCDRP